MLRSCVRGTLFLLTACTLAYPCQGSTIDDILPKIPDGANAIVLVDVPGLHKSKVGIQFEWVKKHEADFREGRIPFPPTSNMIVLASQMTPGTQTKAWEIALLEMRKNVSLKDIAAQERGVTETVAGQEVVLSCRNCYVTTFSPRLVGFQFPANRQELARWLRFTQRNTKPVLSEYLLGAVAELEKKGQVIMAYDLDHAFDVQIVRKRLEGSKVLAGKQIDLDGLAKMLASVKGMKMTIRATDAIRAELTLEFGRDVRPYAEILKPLLADSLATRRDDLQNLDKWDMLLGQKEVIYRHNMTLEEFRTVLTQIQPPAATTCLIDQPPDLPAAAPPDKPALTPSQKYCIKIKDMLAELNKTFPAQTDYYLAAQAVETCAQRVDRLPVKDVDEALLNYSSDVSGKLRMIANSLRGVPMDVANLALQRQSFSSFTPAQPAARSWWPGGGFLNRFGGGIVQPQYYYSDNYAQVLAAQNQVMLNETKKRADVWAQIEDASAKVQKKMEAKYNLPFGS